MDSDYVEVRGEGEDFPSEVLTDLQASLAEIRKRYPVKLGHRDPEGGKFEKEACTVVHEALPFDAQMLTDFDFWTWLALEFRELVDWRHGGKRGKAHSANFGIGAKQVDNLFYRLWLRAELGRVENARDQYDLARKGDQDFWRSHIFRQSYSRSRPLVHVLVKLQYPNKDGTPRWKTAEIREIAKRLKCVNATLIFDALDEKAARNLVEQEARSVD